MPIAVILLLVLQNVSSAAMPGRIGTPDVDRGIPGPIWICTAEGLVPLTPNPPDRDNRDRSGHQGCPCCVQSTCNGAGLLPPRIDQSIRLAVTMAAMVAVHRYRTTSRRAVGIAQPRAPPFSAFA
ncbi:MAG: hypothetical protein H6851_20570 [Geminicoccaceae bacterium]|nr:hypothetical protein [Geminicoccaceae bacterium]